jgi:release factor glutamine methyltransferase
MQAHSGQQPDAGTLGDALKQATARLADAGRPEARLEAELLLCAAADIGRATLFAWPERALGAEQSAAFEALVQRRLQGEPIAYLLGRRDFHDLTLTTGPGALIPRPETELLVDWALAALPADTPLQCADLGTGTGAIALALALARPAWTLIAVEREPPALAVAAQNRARLAPGNLTLIRGDWLGAFAPRSLDLVVGNPPYVATADPHLSRGDLRHEPIEALAAGADGLAAMRRIIAQSVTVVRPGGLLLLEHGWQQGAEVRALLRRAGWRDIVTRRDLAKRERATGARRSDG